MVNEGQSNDLEQLNQLMAVFCSAMRYSFNRLIEGEKEGNLIKRIQDLFHINKRYAEDAVLQAKAVMSSQEKLLPIRLEGCKRKFKKRSGK